MKTQAHYRTYLVHDSTSTKLGYLANQTNVKQSEFVDIALNATFSLITHICKTEGISQFEAVKRLAVMFPKEKREELDALNLTVNDDRLISEFVDGKEGEVKADTMNDDVPKGVIKDVKDD